MLFLVIIAVAGQLIPFPLTFLSKSLYRQYY